MSKLVYGVFESAQGADEALAELKLPPEQFNAVVHGGHVREEDIQLAGTDALKGAILGGIVVGVMGMLAAVLLVWPSHGWPDTWIAGLVMGFCGSLFGVIAGAVAGASECKAPIRAEAQFAEKRGKVMVTCELDRHRDASAVRETFDEHGGEHVDAA